MTDLSASSPTPGPDDLVPSSIPFSQRAVFPNTTPAPTSWRSPALDDRLKVLGLLSYKMRKLNRSLDKLDLVPREGLTYAQLEEIADQTRETQSEYGFCKSRYDQIDYGAPFKPLPAGAEAGLLAAITAVDAHTGGAAALTGLLRAVHGLVIAYGGKDA